MNINVINNGEIGSLDNEKSFILILNHKFYGPYLKIEENYNILLDLLSGKEVDAKENRLKRP